MQILINDLKRHHEPLASELTAAVNRVMSRGWYIQGPEVESFEAEFAQYCGVEHCVGVGNGTDALELALRAAGIGPGAEVATAANAGMYSTTAILRAGAVPVYVDVDERSMTMSPAALRATLSPETSAVIVTHLYGQLAEIEELRGIAERQKLPLIEDCAQAHGAERAGRKSGSWGTLGCFSFYPTKNLGAMGDGGAVVTGDAILAAKVRALRQYGWTGKYRSTVPGGRNSRLDEMQAAVLRAKLPHLGAWNDRRREIARKYGEALDGSGLILPATEDDYVAHLYVVRSAQRERLRRALAEAGIGTDVHYPIPDPRQESMRDVTFRGTLLPVTETAADQVLTLPCFPEMTDGEVAEIAQAVLAALR
jgi:dTDP-3-amino-2,3,6-trideoxy-4-keto-D-glucose/dTDP-3-amino-3,4,6-trideoxy-alpha-D-glucose/dTDP-2,6-dideoxy-D-kanosamine transaminase